MRRLLLFMTISLFCCAVSSAQQTDSKRKSMEDAFIEQMKMAAKMDVLSRIKNDSTCLLNYYCYLCDGTGEPLSRLRNLTVSLSDFTGA